MQFGCPGRIINNIIDGEPVDVTAEFFRVIADPFQNPFEFAVILGKKSGDPARFPEVKRLEDDPFGLKDHFSRKSQVVNRKIITYNLPLTAVSVFFPKQINISCSFLRILWMSCGRWSS